MVPGSTACRQRRVQSSRERSPAEAHGDGRDCTLARRQTRHLGLVRTRRGRRDGWRELFRDGRFLELDFRGANCRSADALHFKLREHSDGLLAGCVRLESATEQQSNVARQLVGQRGRDDLQRRKQNLEN